MSRERFKHKNDEQVRELTATILSRDFNDPRLFLTTVTGAVVSPDKSVASIYVSADPDRYDEVLAGLESAKGRLRTLLGQVLSWRTTPQLRFFIDESIDEGERIARTLAEDRMQHASTAQSPVAGDSDAAARER
jgi:ribosome-binding factor A